MSAVTSRQGGGGGLQDLLDHAARELSAAAGLGEAHDVALAKRDGGALEGTQQARPHTSSWSSAGLVGQRNADGTAMRNRSPCASGAIDATTTTREIPSRKRQRMLSPEVASRPARRGANNNAYSCSEDGEVTTSESCSEGAEAVGERSVPGTALVALS